MTLPREHRAMYGPGENVGVIADPAAIESARFIKITGKHSSGIYKGQHCAAGERAFGVSERRVPALPASTRPNERHTTNCNRIGAVAQVEAGAAITALALVTSDSVGRAVAATAAAAASLATGVVGSNNAITWTSTTAGAAGNSRRVQLRDPAGNSQALSVDVDGNDIIVSLATNGGGAITSTAAQVIAAVLEDNTSSQMVTPANTGASTGAGVVAAVALTALAGGTDATSDGHVNGRALTAAAAAGDIIEVDRF